MNKIDFAVVIMFILISQNSCFPVKSLFLGAPDKGDVNRFESRTINAGETCFQYHNTTDSSTACRLKVNDWTSDIPFFVPLDQLFNTHKTRSFLLLRNDTILYEYYGLNTDSSSLHSSYSIAKCYTSTLIGIAIDEGLIGSEKDLVSKYIPEFPEVPEKKLLTIEHLLNHTSGIKYSLTLDALIYYGDDVMKSLNRIKFSHPPGKKQHYININVQLLGLILFRATGKYPSEYLEQKIWKPTGACTRAKWSVDRKNKLEKTFCCMAATTRDYAKFGSLYLNKGIWGSHRIFSEEWYYKSTRRDSSDGSSFNYNYCWHIGLKEYADFMAIGLFKQHIYIHPQKNIVMVLLNNKENKLLAERVNWWYVFRQIVDQL